MWKGSTLFEKSLKGSRTLFWTLFLAYCGSFKEKQYTAYAILALPCGSGKGIEKEKEGGAENFNRPF